MNTICLPGLFPNFAGKQATCESITFTTWNLVRYQYVTWLIVCLVLIFGATIHAGGSRKQTKRTPEQELYLTVLKGRQRDKYYPTFNQFQGMSALYNEDRRLPASLNCPGNPNWWKALANLK